MKAFLNHFHKAVTGANNVYKTWRDFFGLLSSRGLAPRFIHESLSLSVKNETEQKNRD